MVSKFFQPSLRYSAAQRRVDRLEAIENRLEAGGLRSGVTNQKLDPKRRSAILAIKR
jgi:protein-disulfide isomerase-like protein with CxxC motif